MDTPSLYQWLQKSDDANRDMVPFYFILEYLWYHWVMSSILGMRLLSVAIGVLTIVLTFAACRDLWGPRAALTASLCCALSPFQIYYSQEVRPYGLMALLGLVSAYAFYKALYERKRWYWPINVVANGLLMWTHLFGIWLLFAEGMALLWSSRRAIARLMVWSQVHVTLLIPIALLVMTWKAPGDPPLRPPWFEVASTLTLMDAYETVFFVFCRTLTTPRELFGQLPGWFLYVFLASAATFSCILLGGACVQIWRSRRHFVPAFARSFEGADRTPQGRASVYLLWWYIVPFCLLLAFSVAIVPAFQLRYVIYSSPALYMLAAAGLAGMRHTWARRVVTALLAVSMAVVAAAQVNLPMRGDYRGAGRYVQEHRAAGEAVFWRPEFTRRTFEFNLSKTLPPLNPITLSGLDEEMQQIDARLDRNEGVWVLHDMWRPDWAQAQCATLERYLDMRRLTYEKRVFPGRFDIPVYHLTRGPGYVLSGDNANLTSLLHAVTMAPFEAPIRENLLRALDAAGRAGDAVDLCRRELLAIPDDPAARAEMENALQLVKREDDHNETSALDDYVSGLATAWERLLERRRPTQEDEACLERLPERFPGNQAVRGLCERVRRASAGNS